VAKLKPDEILKRVKKEGFERVWAESASLIPMRRMKKALVKLGKTHPVFDLVQKLRRSFIRLGFSEVLNPIVVDEAEIYKQYGPEAAVILDRCYYLATLPKPEIGLSKDKREELEKLGVKLTHEKLERLQRVLRDYKKGVIASDDLVEKIAEALEVSDIEATRVITKVFPEFMALKSQPTTLTLRSHMTSVWFGTLQALQHKVEMPLRLFSIDFKFRREQQEDPTHLRSSFVASCVVMDGNVSVKDCEEIVEKLLAPFGIKKFRFVKKKVTSRYYTPGTEYEAFVYFPAANKWVEVANFGLYNPIALARYGIEHPVLNVGVGVERVAMILSGELDMRRLAYPQFYAEWTLSDAQIAKVIKVAQQPKTQEGKKLLDSIIKTALRYAEKTSPCEFTAFKGSFLGRNVEVAVYEPDIGAKLLGPAALNKIYVYDSNVLGIPARGLEEKPLVQKARKNGVSTGIRYLDAVAALTVSKIEEAVEKGGSEEVNIRVRMAKLPSDVNIQVGDVAQRYITGKKRIIDVRGPVFVGIKAKIFK